MICRIVPTSNSCCCIAVICAIGTLPTLLSASDAIVGAFDRDGDVRAASGFLKFANREARSRCGDALEIQSTTRFT